MARVAAFPGFRRPDDIDFLRPAHAARHPAYCRRTGQTIPETPGEFVRVCLESLAFKYRYTFEKLTDILGRAPAIFHIVGGAARNQMLNQFAANALARPVVAGPSEATALGNLIMQMIAMGDLADLEDGRRLIRASFPPRNICPKAYRFGKSIRPLPGGPACRRS
jgi:rhamnulokinase